jgi:hypothetical protein
MLGKIPILGQRSIFDQLRIFRGAQPVEFRRKYHDAWLDTKPYVSPIAEAERRGACQDYLRVMEKSTPKLEIIPIGPPNYKKILHDLTKPLGT